jgi:hypothetical protein
MPADGISLPPEKRDFGMSRWGGSKVRLHPPRDWVEGAFPVHFFDISGGMSVAVDSRHKPEQGDFSFRPISVMRKSKLMQCKPRISSHFVGRKFLF